MVGIEIDARRLNEGIRALAANVKNLERVAASFGGHVVRRIAKSFKRIGREAQNVPGGFPATRHGGYGLRGSISYNVLSGGAGVEIGTPLVYGGVLHFGTQEYLGGPIRPVQAKALSVPVADESRGKRPRDFPDLEWRPNVLSKRGGIRRGVLGVESAEDFEPLFALQTEVTIEPYPWLEIVEEDTQFLADALQKQFERELK